MAAISVESAEDDVVGTYFLWLFNVPFLQQHLDFGSPFLDYTVTKKLTALLKLTECSLHVLMVRFIFGREG
jgi:hypothetical protein